MFHIIKMLSFLGVCFYRPVNQPQRGYARSKIRYTASGGKIKGRGTIVCIQANLFIYFMIFSFDEEKLMK